jgi:hypothetical protein
VVTHHQCYHLPSVSGSEGQGRGGGESPGRIWKPQEVLSGN